MYAGDKLSRKETSIIPKTQLGDQKSEDVLNLSEMRQTYLSTEASHNQTSITQKVPEQTPRRSGTMRCNQYPTTQFLKASKAKKHMSDYSDASNHGSGCQSSATDAPNIESDFSDVYSIRSDDEAESLSNEVLVKTFNEQGHYATKQSIEKTLGYLVS